MKDTSNWENPNQRISQSIKLRRKNNWLNSTKKVMEWASK